MSLCGIKVTFAAVGGTSVVSMALCAIDVTFVVLSGG
jgi:hypothetical protein